MPSMFPTDFYNGTLITSSKLPTRDIPLLVDYLIDLDTGYPIVSKSGQFTIVEGLEAIVMQMWRKLHIERGIYQIFSSKYGNTFDDLKGKGKSYADAYANKKLIEAVVDKVYVNSVNNVDLSLDGSIYTISFTIDSIYGNTEFKLNIPLED
jgi:hypothetical protein